jgi:hypothetical protein
MNLEVHKRIAITDTAREFCIAVQNCPENLKWIQICDDSCGSNSDPFNIPPEVLPDLIKALLEFIK